MKSLESLLEPRAAHRDIIQHGAHGALAICRDAILVPEQHTGSLGVEGQAKPVVGLLGDGLAARNKGASEHACTHRQAARVSA